MGEYIDTVFGPNGTFARRFQGYAPRRGQIELTRAVDRAIEENAHLMAEAPTGTGKSIAYLVPAIQHAVKHNKRVLVVTGNIALQEQLVGKDLPLLAEVLPWDFSFALLKGRQNYLCPSRLHEQEAEPQLDMPGEPFDADMYQAILAWAETTETGDKSELPFEPPARLWRRFSIASEDCKGSECRLRDKCFAAKAKARAEEAMVVIANYHLLLLHLHLREITGRDLILPPFDIAVCDEGHKMADIAREFFGFRVTAGSVRWAGRLLDRIGRIGLAKALEAAASVFIDALDAYERSEAYERRLRAPGVVPHQALRAALVETFRAYQEGMEEEVLDPDARAELTRAMARAMALVLQLDSSMGLTDEGSVYFLERLPKGGVALASKVVDVSERLRKLFFDATPSVIVTSATLTTGGSFEHAKREMGVLEARELVVESPFDFEKQALLIVPEGMPSPQEPVFADAVADVVARIVDLAEGRTLGLFTSYRNMNAAYERLAGCGYRVLRQGDAPRTQLIEAFRKDVRSVLLGTESFWAGVDVPGESLSCVIIDRLPFPPPDDPVLDAVSERDPDWFQDFSLPRAIIAFKQGFGRLIRSQLDRGVVVVLDERLVTKRYGKKFIRSLPYTLKSRRLAHVRQFLAEAA
jgi:ATP-dependent DNA helicase DinG